MQALLDQVFAYNKDPYAIPIEEVGYAREMLVGTSMQTEAGITMRRLVIRHSPATYTLRELRWNDASRPLGFIYCFWVTKSKTNKQFHEVQKTHFFIARERLYGATLLSAAQGAYGIDDIYPNSYELSEIQQSLNVGALFPTSEDAFECESTICTMAICQRPSY